MTASRSRAPQPLLRPRPMAPFGLLVEVEGARPDIRELSSEQIRQWVREHRVVVLRGLPIFPSKEEMAAYCATWGELLEWNFGTVLELVVHDEPKNYLFTHGNVPFHWDGAFARATPSFMFFQCVKAPLKGTGGETTFSDTTRVWEAASPEQRQLWSKVVITYATQKLAHYGGEVTVPLVSKHPVTGATTLRFAEELNEESVPLNPLFLNIQGVAEERRDAFLGQLRETLYHPEHCLAHPWQDGDILICDNHALLHGRKPFHQGSPRHLRRVHIL